MSMKRSTGMSFVARERFAAEMVACLKPREGIDRRRGGGFLPKNGLQSLDHEFFESRSTPSRHNLGALQQVVGKIDGRLHMAIYTEILPPCRWNFSNLSEPAPPEIAVSESYRRSREARQGESVEWDSPRWLLA